MSAGFRGVRIESGLPPTQKVCGAAARRRRGAKVDSLDDNGVAFKWKDYRIDASQRFKVMTPASSSTAS
jgi:hypothetical protein